jgi:dipeptidyl aminopeptidase/acylaminoacyl peptidase
MKLRNTFVALFALVAFGQTQRPLQLQDLVNWKRIGGATVSNNGEWFAYRQGPSEGDAEIVIRNLKTSKDLKFPIGDPTATQPPISATPTPPPDGAPAGPMGAVLAISADSKWAAFQVFPTEKETKRLKTTRRPIQTKVALIELATGKKTEFEKARRFAFSGEKATAIAIHRYGPEAPPTPPPAPGVTPPERPTGSDLLLHELASGDELNIGNVSDFAFNKAGDWLAWVVDATDKAGNGVVLRNMSTGAVLPLDHAQANYRSLSWNEKGDAFTALRGIEDKAWEDKLYSVVAFRDLKATGAPSKIVFDPKDDASFPKGMSIAGTRAAMWREDASLMFGIHELRPKKQKGPATPAAGENKDTAAAPPATPPAPAAEAEPDKPELVIWHYKDPRLQSMQQVQEGMDRNFSYTAIYRPGDHKFMRLAEESVRQVSLGVEQKMGMGTDVREYELESNLSGKSYRDVYTVDPTTGARKLALAKARYVMGSSPDGSTILHYDDGVFFAYDVATGKSTDLTSKIPTKFWNEEDDHNVVKPPHFPVGWSKDSSIALLSDGWDIWSVPVRGGQPVNLTGNGRKDKIHYQRRFRLDPDERAGIDLSQPMYVSMIGDRTKQGGIAVIEPGKPGAKVLLSGEANFNQLMKAKNADVYIYTKENTQEFANYFSANARLENGQQLTNANPQQKDFLWTKGVKLIDYTSTNGDKLQGALWLPANYEPGKKYPMLVYIYEKLTQGTYSYPTPSYNGSNIAHYTSNGYAVFYPDIVYKVNDPGKSAVACVVPAVKAAIATGIVNAEKVGIHGHSWGGYQTAYLVTQTDVFHAAVAGAPLTDLVSMYSILYRNSGSTNQPIFESSQGRFTSGYFDNQEAYLRNSPVYFAKNVKTPLMILHNDKDGAVDQTQGIEYYNTLRRLNKPVIMLEYKGENHGLRKPENMKDYTVRMREFFDHYLMDKPAPKWMTDGIPLLKMKDHLEERTKEINKPVSPTTATPAAAPAAQ